MYDNMEMSGNAHVYIVTQSVRYICNTRSKIGTCRQILVELSNKTVGKFRCFIYIYEGKAIPLQAWTGPEASRSLRLPDFKTVGT